MGQTVRETALRRGAEPIGNRSATETKASHRDPEHHLDRDLQIPVTSMERDVPVDGLRHHGRAETEPPESPAPKG
jgi:hypothetical protein